MTKHITAHGLLLDGHGFASPDEAIAEARLWFEHRGAAGFEFEKAVTLARTCAAVTLAWYCDEFGFVQEQHPQAQPVTVVAMLVNDEWADPIGAGG